MTGWRAALMAGNAEVVERYRHLKTNLDSGMFNALQRAAAAALTDAREFPQEMSAVYERRRDLVAAALRAIGLDVDPPKATPYFWVRVPDGYTSASFADLVLEQANVVVAPGPSYGASGEGFVRISLTVPDKRLEEAVGRIESSLRAGILSPGRHTSPTRLRALSPSAGSSSPCWRRERTPSTSWRRSGSWRAPRVSNRSPSSFSTAHRPSGGRTSAKASSST